MTASLIAVVVASVFPLVSALPTVVRAAGSTSTQVVSQWDGNGNANDSVGANNGTLIDGTYTPGQSHLAFTLDGVDDYVAIPSSSSLNPASSLSLSALVNPRVVGGGAIITKYDTSATQTSFDLEMVGGGHLDFLVVGPSCDNLHSPDLVDVTTTETVPANQWTQVGATFDAATQAIHVTINGQDAHLQFLQTGTVTSICASSTPVRIGAARNLGGDVAAFFNGQIQDVTMGSLVPAHTTLTVTPNRTSGKSPLRVIYSYSETNDGSTPISGVSVTDDLCKPLVFTGGDTNHNNVLDPGETWTYTCHTTLRGAGPHTDHVTASGTANAIAAPVETAKATVTVAGVHTTLSVTPSATTGTAPLPVTYTYMETNDGTVPLSRVSVSDDSCSPVQFTGGDTNHNNVLDPGETWTFACSHTFTGPGRFVDHVRARGRAQGGGLRTETAQAAVDVSATPTTDLPAVKVYAVPTSCFYPCHPTLAATVFDGIAYLDGQEVTFTINGPDGTSVDHTAISSPSNPALAPVPGVYASFSLGGSPGRYGVQATYIDGFGTFHFSNLITVYILPHLSEVGILLSQDPHTGNSSECTGTVVTSNSHRLLVTAAHCLYAPDIDSNGQDVAGTARHFYNNFRFLPGSKGCTVPELTGQITASVSCAPLGLWTGHPGVDPVIDARYKAGDESYDFAYLVMDPDPVSGTPIQDAVGAISLDFTLGRSDGWTALGYPGSATFEKCTQNGADLSTDIPGASSPLYNMVCGDKLTAGASGGPWLSNNGTIGAVNKQKIGAKIANKLAGTILGTVASADFAQADSTASTF